MGRGERNANHCRGVTGGRDRQRDSRCAVQVATDSQEETDRYWNAILGHDGEENQCGRCTNKWGLWCHITPKALTEAVAKGGEAAKRAFAAMMTMKKIDIAAIAAGVRADDA